MLVVRAAEKPDPRDIMLPRKRESVDVIEFEVTYLRASSAAVIRERAASAISFVDSALDRIRDVP
jgi:hypothetical protein